jgi:small subunit ribosomal protein S18
MAKVFPTRKCYFCANQIRVVDYKNARLLGRYVNSYSKIDARKRSGNCARHQRMVATAIKRSRIAALLPFTTR